MTPPGPGGGVHCTDPSRPPHPGGLPPDRPAPVRAGTRTAQISSAPFPAAALTDEPARVHGPGHRRGAADHRPPCHHRGTLKSQTRRSTSCPEIPLSPWSGTVSYTHLTL